MARRRSFVAFFCLAAVVLAAILVGRGPIRAQQRGVSPNLILVKFKEALSAQEREVLLRSHRMAVVNELSLIGVSVVSIPEGMTVEEALGVLRREPSVVYAEPNYAVDAAGAERRQADKAASQGRRDPQPQFREGQLLVKFVPGANGRGILQNHGMQQLNEFRFIGVHVAGLPPGLSVAQGIEALKNNPNVVYAEPNYVYTIEQTIPNDPSFGQLWGLHNTGQTIQGIPGTSDADIDAPEAWTVRTSAASIVVAVIDTGVDYNHPDLAANMWKNAPEFAGTPGVDDDGNGIIDDIYGARWTGGAGVPTSGNPLDDNNHGSHVSGTIGAVGNNGVGVAGVSWQVQIMALKFLGSSGSGFTADAISAVQYAIQKQAKVMSNSWGGGGFSQALLDAINAANAAGIVFIAAAGNSATDTDTTIFYPAGYNAANVVSVAATDNKDELASFSNFGATTVHLGAPGVYILSTIRNSAYAYFSGTSMATPHVAGASALALAQLGAMPPSQLRMRLMATSDPIPSLTGKTISGGRLNLLKLISPCPAGLSGRPGIPPGFVRYLGEDTILTNTIFQGCGGAITAAVAGFNNGDPGIVMTDNGAAPDKVSGDAIYTGKWRPGIAGTAQPGPVVVTFVASTSGVTIAVPVSGTHIERISYSKSPTAFAWTDISSTGLTLPLSDESWSTIALPFSFKYFGINYNSVTVGSNGTFNFEGKWLGWSPTCIPGKTFYGTQRFIAPFWDDLYPGLSGGTVKYQVMGSQPNRSLTVQWTNVLRYPNSPNGVSFQGVLYEGSNRIAFQYQDTAFGLPGSDNGATAVSGIQDDSKNGLANSCFSPTLSNSTAALFTPGRPRCGVSLPLGITSTTLTLGIGTNRPVSGHWAIGLLIWTGSGFSFVGFPLYSGPLGLIEPPFSTSAPLDASAIGTYGALNVFFKTDGTLCNSSFAWSPPATASGAARANLPTAEQIDSFLRRMNYHDFITSRGRPFVP